MIFVLCCFCLSCSTHLLPSVCVFYLPLHQFLHFFRYWFKFRWEFQFTASGQPFSCNEHKVQILQFSFLAWYPPVHFYQLMYWYCFAVCACVCHTLAQKTTNIIYSQSSVRKREQVQLADSETTDISKKEAPEVFTQVASKSVDELVIDFAPISCLEYTI